MSAQRFEVIAGSFAVVRLDPQAPMPPWVDGAGALVSLTRTHDELSIVCPEAQVPGGLRSEGGWTALKLAGPIPFGEVGVLASFLTPLAAAGVSVFVLSTFDTDYVLVKTDKLPQALEALRTLRG